MSKKRFNLEIPGDLWEQLKAVADERGEPTATLMRRYLRLGLHFDRPGVRVIVEEGGVSREVMLP